jgi:uncharacterized protein
VKYVILLLVIVGVGWWLFGRRPAIGRKPGAAPTRQAMVACAHCGVHLPQSDAVVDARGAFCGEAHRVAGPR